MRIYLMRHAKAVSSDVWKGPDQTRPLSPIGEAQMATAVEHLHRLKISADVLLTSPFVRTMQTADVILDHLHILQSFQCPELASGARVANFLGLILRHADSESLWIVGHMPEMADFAASLIKGARATDYPFETGEIVAVDCSIEDGAISPGRLVWDRRIQDWPTVSG